MGALVLLRLRLEERCRRLTSQDVGRSRHDDVPGTPVFGARYAPKTPHSGVGEGCGGTPFPDPRMLSHWKGSSAHRLRRSPSCKMYEACTQVQWSWPCTHASLLPSDSLGGRRRDEAPNADRDGIDCIPYVAHKNLEAAKRRFATRRRHSPGPSSRLWATVTRRGRRRACRASTRCGSPRAARPSCPSRRAASASPCR